MSVKRDRKKNPSWRMTRSRCVAGLAGFSLYTKTWGTLRERGIYPLWLTLHRFAHRWRTCIETFRQFHLKSCEPKTSPNIFGKRHACSRSLSNPVVFSSLLHLFIFVHPIHPGAHSFPLRFLLRTSSGHPPEFVWRMTRPDMRPR